MPGTTTDGVSRAARAEQLVETRLQYRTKSERAASARSERIARVQRYVSEHYADPLTLRAAAHIAALERTYFSRLFYQQTGVCFRDWLRIVRVSGALPLLREGEMTITQIAFKVGFTDLRGLERACLQFAGACPRNLRFELRGENTTSVATNGEGAR